MNESDTQSKSHPAFIRKPLQLLHGLKRHVLPDFHFASAPFVGRLFRYLVSILKTDFVETAHGHKMYLDARDTHNLSLDKVHEPCETRFFQNVVEEGQVILDIGANIGYYTLLFAKLVGKHGQVFAFEPEPQNFTLLQKNVEVNGYTNVTLENKSIANTSGKLKLFLSDRNKGDHRIYDSHDGREAIEVDSIRLDDYFSGFDKRIDFIKMDIQGAEYFALQGMKTLLRNNPDVVLVTEFEPLGLSCAGIEPKMVLEFLKEFGFEIHHINEDEQRIEDAPIERLLEVYSPENGLHTNLICTKSHLAIWRQEDTETLRSDQAFSDTKTGHLG